MIRAIAAIDDKRGIAAGGKIPWHIPEDTQYYRDKVKHSLVVMGWVTYEQVSQPFSDRRNIVVSSTEQPVRPGFELVTDVESFLQSVQEDVWILGGAGLFSTTLQFCDELYLTHVKGDYHCDRIFPEYDSMFKVAQSSELLTSGEYQYQYTIYQRV